MGIEVYIKSEPCGEYTFGSILKEDLVEYGVLPDGDANGTIPTGEFDNLVHAYGLAVNLDTDLEMILKMDKLSEADKKIIIKNSEIDIWIHGHIHTSSDYQIGKTRIICNPKGYPDEPDSGFEHDFIIEV